MNPMTIGLTPSIRIPKTILEETILGLFKTLF